MRDLHIGDELKLVPETFASGDAEKGPVKSQKCKVVYIHPKKRFFTVEFSTKDWYGEIHRFRESYPFEKLG